MKCNANFRTEYALVHGKEIHIRDYVNGIPTCISHHHELIAVKGEYNRHHFRHKHTEDVCKSPLSEWHAEWQSHFKYTEVPFPLREGQIKSRRADIVIGDFVIDIQYTEKPGTVVEIQHSPITLDEVNHRNHDYGLHHKTVLWVIDGTGVHLQNNIVTFDKDFWKFDSFLGTPYVYLDIQGVIYSFCPAEVKSCCVHVSDGIHKQVFIQSLTDGVNVFHQPRIQNKLYIKQQGAGNGKTWGIIQMLSRSDFSHYTRFIYVTKQHSARTIIHEEFLSQQASLGITHVIPKESSKKYIIQYTNAIGLECSIVISTIDSFMYALGDKQSKSRDLFEGIVRSIYETRIMDTTTEKNGRISYANQPQLNAHTLYIVDETQDLHETYADALCAIMNHTNMDVYVVGDKLQSIHFEENAFTKLMTKEYAIQETPINCCRRFIHPTLVEFVNEMIPFEKFQLLPITPWTEYTGKEYTPIELFPIIKYDNAFKKTNIEECVTSFMWRFEKEVVEHDRCPEDFLIITPWVKSSSSVELINHVDIKIQEFWVNQLQNKEFTAKLSPYWKNHDVNVFTNYSVLHRTEEGSCINLDDSKHATRIVSIHASKGDGRKVVFLIDPSLFKLSAFSMKDSLKFYSTLHVALTRMKEKLYIMHDDDEVGTNLKNAISKTNCPFRTDTLHISNSTSFKELSTLVTPTTELFKTHEHVVYGDESDPTQIIDLSHHNIRRWIMLMKTYDILKDGDQLTQIATIVGYAMGNRTCVPWKTWNQYNEDLKKNYVKCSDPRCWSRREEGKYCFQHMKEPKKYDRHIPLLELNTGEHRRYVSILQQTMKKIKYNFTAQIPLCPFELVVQLYMVQVTDKGQYTQITMNELYNVIDIYSKSFKHYMKGHDTCLCKKLFPHHEHKNTLSDYLCSHYEYMESYEKSVQHLKDTYGRLSWNINHKVYTEGKHFGLHTTFDLIGYTDSKVVIVYITPKLTNLNFNDIKYNAVIDRFIVQHCSTKDNNRYTNKEVVCCILSLNQKTPYLLPLHDVPDMKHHIGALLKQKYELKHNEVKAFYDHWMDKEGSAIKVANEYTKQEHEYYIKYKKIKNASYITSVFEYIQDECDVEFTQLSSTGKTSLIHLLQTRLEKRLEQDGLWKKK